MRRSTIALLICFNISFVSIQKINAQYALNGVWLPVKQEMGGRPFPSSVYDNYKLTIADSIYIYSQPAGADKGTIFYTNGKMDIYGKEGVNIGKHYTASYKMENGQLTICYNLSGNGYPEAFDTKDKPMYFLSVYKKE